MYFEIAPIAIINMVCFGNETSVLNCSFSVLDRFYSYYWWFFHRSLVVSCQGSSKSIYYYNFHFIKHLHNNYLEGEYPQSTCNDGDIRLVNGANELQGRVEICNNNVWGTVCSNYPSPSNSEKFGNLICKQLGYQRTGILFFYTCTTVHVLYHVNNV